MPPPRQFRNRYAGPPVLGGLAERILRPVYERFGFGAGDIIAHWPQIVGEDLAAYTSPVRLAWPRRGQDKAGTKSAVLTIRAEGPRAIEVQHMIPQIIERTNVYFGFRAVTGVHVIQAPLQARHRAGPRQEDADETMAANADLDDPRLADIAEPRLRSALSRLGHAVRRSGKHKKIVK